MGHEGHVRKLWSEVVAKNTTAAGAEKNPLFAAKPCFREKRKKEEESERSESSPFVFVVIICPFLVQRTHRL
jgi:hypothetical protein